jgi:hypothetical protein
VGHRGVRCVVALNLMGDTLSRRCTLFGLISGSILLALYFMTLSRSCCYPDASATSFALSMVVARLLTSV